MDNHVSSAEICLPVGKNGLSARMAEIGLTAEVVKEGGSEL
jgi:hypothetical protein